MSQPVVSAPVTPAKGKCDQPPCRVKLYSFPKIVFLYPTCLAALVAGALLSLWGELDPADTRDEIVAVVFLVLASLNLVILAHDFPRATSLTLFFFAVAVAMGVIILFMKRPDLLPAVTHLLSEFRPAANAMFFWGFGAILGLIILTSLTALPFDFWEVRPNEILHHHGILSNLERFPAPGLRVDKEIVDVFEFLLLGSGRLIIQIANERRAVILDNVPFIRSKESQLTRLLGAVHVELHDEDHGLPV